MPTLQERLTEFNKSRLPDMLKLKYKAMSLNVFSFYRGTCHIFYEDLAANNILPRSPLTWTCGDLHLENFGCFKGDNRLEYFDLNDFDEAILAPAAWEIVRLITSIFVEYDNLGLKQSEAVKLAQTFLNIYGEVLKNGKPKGIDPRTADGVVHEFLKQVEKRKQKDLLEKRTRLKKDELVLLQDTDLHFEVEKALKKELTEFIDKTIKTIKCVTYNYKVVDCIFRVAGTGSIGVKRYMFLLKNQNVKKKYLLLDMKQAMPSSLKTYVQIKQPEWGTEAERVIAIQERMQNVNPALFTAVVFKDVAYVINQLQPTEDKINFDVLRDRFDDVRKVIKDMAILTASAQLRSSGRQGSAIADDLVVYGENNEWHEAILKYARHYKTTVKKDYQEFMSGYKKGLYQ